MTKEGWFEKLNKRREIANKRISYMAKNDRHRLYMDYNRIENLFLNKKIRFTTHT